MLNYFSARHRWSKSIDIKTNIDKVFWLTQNYGERLNWDPYLRIAKLVDGATEVHVGTRAWCVSNWGLGMETQYVSFNPPRVAAVKMTRGPYVIKEFAGSWRFQTIGEDLVRVTFTYRYKIRPNCLTLLAQYCFTQDMEKRLLALKRYVELNQIK